MKKINFLLITFFIFMAGCTSQLETNQNISKNEFSFNHDNHNNHNNHDIHSINNIHENHAMHQNHMVSSEYEFILEMIPHHQEAVDSSIELLEKTKNQQLINLANDIIQAQNKEIEMMNTWLEQWYPTENRNSNYIKMMPNLNNYQNISRDNAYLESMIVHHQMAVVMARSVLEIEGIRNEVKNLANEIILVQNQEIEIMKNLIIN